MPIIEIPSEYLFPPSSRKGEARLRREFLREADVLLTAPLTMKAMYEFLRAAKLLMRAVDAPQSRMAHAISTQAEGMTFALLVGRTVDLGIVHNMKDIVRSWPAPCKG